MIHTYKMFEDYMVVDVNNGGVYQVDEVCYRLLENLDTIEQYNSEIDVRSAEVEKYLVDSGVSLDDAKTMVAEARKEITELIDVDALYSVDQLVNYVPFMKSEPVLKALCLHISHDCNLRCKYCFAGTGDFGGQRSMMSFEVGKKAIDLLIKESKHRKNLEVDFFGGEPLMNFDVVKQIVDYARSREAETGKNFRFTITTNAMLLSEDKMDYINEVMDNVVLSIDGRKSTNDNMRTCVNGAGSYDIIMPKIKKMVEKRDGKRYYARGTFTRENLDFSADVIHLADEGFKEISVEPVVAAQDCGLDLREQDLPKLYEEYENLAAEYVARGKKGEGFNFFHFMIDLNNGPCIAKRLSGCGAGYEYAAVTPDGELYPCHQFVGQEGFVIGNVDEGMCNMDLRKEFKSSNIYTKPDCKDCWAKFYCSGGCSANAWQFNKDINSTYKVGCDLEKKRLECALWIKAQELNNAD